jgi:hypothetical protein
MVSCAALLVGLRNTPVCVPRWGDPRPLRWAHRVFWVPWVCLSGQGAASSSTPVWLAPRAAPRARMEPMRQCGPPCCQQQASVQPPPSRPTPPTRTPRALPAPRRAPAAAPDDGGAGGGGGGLAAGQLGAHGLL